ncbi:MAG TPA: ABC transporter substrate-binding protein [Microvirga sp.]|jgi:trehalose/maltose transport system substrate-binding protein|nr:ABC transporter substrate-binding protein [Microvirga sp.]
MLKSLKLLAAVAGLAFATSASAQSATVSIACGTVGAEFERCREGTEAWSKKTGHQVRLVQTPASATERLAVYQQLLAARSGDVDVFQIDVVWPGILGTHFIDMSKAMGDEIKNHFPPIVAANTVNNQLVGVPWFTDAGILYYRKDLLEKHGRQVPTTWAELTETAQVIQEKERAANANFWGMVFQAKAYEGLTCNALEWIDSFGGGTIVSQDGKITVNNPKAVEALTLAASWVNKLAPQGVLNYTEEEARGVFQSGNAVFMRNWPYAWALVNAGDSPVKDKVGIAALPKGGADGKNSGTLGGWQLAVSKYSKNQEAAIDLVKYLTSAEEQKRRAVTGGFTPTLPALYQDADILKANPHFKELFTTFTSAVARPSAPTGERYNQVSSEFYGAVHRVLSGQDKPEASLANVQRTLDRLSRGGRW